MVTSYGETVGQLLQRLGIEVTMEDRLSHDQLEETFDGMEISIDRIVTCRETFSATVPREIRYCAEESLPLGMEKVISEGQDGELLRTADVTYTNGTETHRSILSETVLRKPVTETVAVGAAEGSPEALAPSHTVVNAHTVGITTEPSPARPSTPMYSVPGTAKEICTLFLAMGAGLIAGMGYLGFAALFTVVMCAAFLAYNCLDLGAAKNAALYRVLNVTIPEDLDYTGVFDDIFTDYTKSCELIRVKTTNMGSMFRLTYNITLREPSKEKELIETAGLFHDIGKFMLPSGVLRKPGKLTPAEFEIVKTHTIEGFHMLSADCFVEVFVQFKDNVVANDV